LVEKRERRRKLSVQVEKKINNTQLEKLGEYKGSDSVVSTGSTLLDLAISGGRFPFGGIPTGILVEIFGPPGAGKTALLAQLAANVQHMGGNVMFHDPEARLNIQFAKMFGLEPENIEYSTPNTVTGMFNSIREWIENQPEGQIHAVFADSLAALSTDLEMGKDEGDKMGMRRAKEFSEQLRKTCRLIKQKNTLLVCSNQIRQNLDAGPYGMRYKSPGGEAIGFYSSLRLRCSSVTKIKRSRTIRGKSHERVVGVQTTIDVFKSSVWKPYRTADVYILFDYGIDDVRGNLAFLKSTVGEYKLGDEVLGKNIEAAIRKVEEENLEQRLREEVVSLWNEVEQSFAEERKPKVWW